jgi:DHA1 family multidrug resistance protein-like MFS transporter
VALGLNNAFMSLGRIAGPLWAGFIFEIDLRYPYISDAFVMLAGFIVILAWLHGKRPYPTPISQPSPK